MVNYWNELDEETIGMLNGYCVMNALASQKSEITEDELLERFITSTDQPHNLVEYELKRILYNGVIGGFITRTGNSYSIPGLDNMYEVDCDEEESKDVKPPGMELRISTPGSPGITVKVEPGTAVSVVPYETSSGPCTSSGALGSTRESRKRSSTSSSSHSSPKKPKLEIQKEIDDLVAMLKARPKLNLTDRFASRAPRLLRVDEDESLTEFPRRRRFVPEPFGEEDEDEGEPAQPGVAEDEVEEPPRRRSTRVRVPAKGKCGGLTCPSKCKF